MTDLICIYMYGDEVYIHDKSDMTLEVMHENDVKEYI